jgi:F-box/leucine-rich repeat protein 2/20
LLFKRNAEKCQLLEYLDLKDLKLLTDASLLEVSKYLIQLRFLGLENCQSKVSFFILDQSDVGTVSDSGLKEIAKGCKKLSSLNLSGCPEVTDVALEEMANQRMRLEALWLCECKKIQGHGVARLVEKIQTLRLLDMEGSALPDEVIEWTMVGLVIY